MWFPSLRDTFWASGIHSHDNDLEAVLHPQWQQSEGLTVTEGYLYLACQVPLPGSHLETRPQEPWKRQSHPPAPAPARAWSRAVSAIHPDICISLCLLHLRPQTLMRIPVCGGCYSRNERPRPSSAWCRLHGSPCDQVIACDLPLSQFRYLCSVVSNKESMSKRLRAVSEI